MVAAMAVPTTKPIKIEMDLINPLVKMLIKRIIKTVIAASKRLWPVGSGTLFPIFPIATGIKVSPIVVITDPVTIEGKRLATFEKMPEIKTT